MDKGRFIDYEAVTNTWVECPNCEGEIKVPYGAYLPDYDVVECKKCKKEFQVDYWDEEKDDPIEPVMGWNVC